MFIHAVAAGLLLAGLLLLIFFVLALAHFAFFCNGRQGQRSLNHRRRIPVFLVSAGFLFLQLMSEVYCPSARFLLAEKCDEDADEDDSGDPESPKKHFMRQLKRIRRGEKVGDLVLRL
ncbi:MAG: hypothetical protein WBP85_04285 [Terracidiphilus sp.]